MCVVNLHANLKADSNEDSIFVKFENKSQLEKR